MDISFTKPGAKGIISCKIVKNGNMTVIREKDGNLLVWYL